MLNPLPASLGRTHSAYHGKRSWGREKAEVIFFDTSEKVEALNSLGQSLGQGGTCGRGVHGSESLDGDTDGQVTVVWRHSHDSPFCILDNLMSYCVNVSSCCNLQPLSLHFPLEASLGVLFISLS